MPLTSGLTVNANCIVGFMSLMSRLLRLEIKAAERNGVMDTIALMNSDAARTSSSVLPFITRGMNIFRLSLENIHFSRRDVSSSLSTKYTESSYCELMASSGCADHAFPANNITPRAINATNFFIFTCFTPPKMGKKSTLPHYLQESTEN